MNDGCYHSSTKTHMEALAKAMRVHLHRDPCGDFVVEGERGNIHADGTGYGVAVMCPDGKGWNIAKVDLGTFCRVTQDGDSEGVLHMPALPTRDQAKLLRDTLCIHKIKEYSPKTIEAMRQRLAQHRFVRPSAAPAQIATAVEVE